MTQRHIKQFNKWDTKFFSNHHHHHHHRLILVTWWWWVQINYLHCPRSCVIPITPLNASSSNVLIYPYMSWNCHVTSIVVLVCLCFFCLWIAHVWDLVHLLSLYTIRVLVELFCWTVRVEWVPDCLMPSLLIFCSQLISAVEIFYHLLFAFPTVRSAIRIQKLVGSSSQIFSSRCS